MGMSRWWMLGAVLPLVAGCGGGSSDTDDRVRFGAYMGFGTSGRDVVETATVTRFNQVVICQEADASNVLVDPEVELEASYDVVSLPLAFAWVNNDLDTQRVEVLDAGFKVEVYKDEVDDPDVLIWTGYDNLRRPSTGKNKESLDAIRDNAELSDEERETQIAALDDLFCYQPGSELEENGVLTTIDIPQSESLPPVDADLWPTLPEVANFSFIAFNGWSGDGSIEAVAGNYYVDFSMTINLPGESQPETVRRTFIIEDAE